MNQLNISAKRKLSLFFFFSFFAFFILIPSSSNKAQAWDAAPANIMLFTMNNIYASVQDTILSSIKMEAFTFISEEIDNTLGLGTSVAGVVNGEISDWEAFLVEEPGNQVASYLEEFLFNATGGRSSANYRSKVGSSSNNRYSEGFGKNETIRYGLIRTASASSTTSTSYEDGGAAYREQLKKINDSIKEEKQAEWSFATEEPNYERNPQLMFSKNNLRDFDLFLSGINNSWSYSDYKNRKLQNNYENKRLELTMRAMIGKGLWDEDLRSAVAESAVKDYYSTMDLDLLKGAKSIPEASVYMTLIKVNKVLKKSIRNVRKSYQKDLAVYRSQITSSVMNNFTGSKPQDVFKEQLQDKQARQNKFSTGANYESLNVDAEISQRENLKNRTLTTGQIQER